ncbi:hypothetical protein RF55_5447 [Lasius niger]|uniref:Uncharacterized protein n=1 Tax=Lasius niger TaxID=67767 RepID=A0A0J7NPJ6_LASNI|nr:hypothetical protein RF55_5447 [Lasius niger]
MEAIPGQPVQRHPQQRISDGTASPSALPGVVVVLQPDTREPGSDWAAVASPGILVVAVGDSVDGADDGDGHDDDDARDQRGEAGEPSEASPTEPPSSSASAGPGSPSPAAAGGSAPSEAGRDQDRGRRRGTRGRCRAGGHCHHENDGHGDVHDGNNDGSGDDDDNDDDGGGDDDDDDDDGDDDLDLVGDSNGDRYDDCNDETATRTPAERRGERRRRGGRRRERRGDGTGPKRGGETAKARRGRRQVGGQPSKDGKRSCESSDCQRYRHGRDQGTNGGDRVGAGTGNAGLTEGKEGGGATRGVGFWQRHDDTDDAGDGFGRDQVGAVMPRGERDERRGAVSPWKTHEPAAGGLEAPRQVLLLPRRQATPRRPAAPCK